MMLLKQRANSVAESVGSRDDSSNAAAAAGVPLYSLRPGVYGGAFGRPPSADGVDDVDRWSFGGHRPDKLPPPRDSGYRTDPRWNGRPAAAADRRLFDDDRRDGGGRDPRSGRPTTTDDERFVRGRPDDALWYGGRDAGRAVWSNAARRPEAVYPARSNDVREATGPAGQLDRRRAAAKADPVDRPTHPIFDDTDAAVLPHLPRRYQKYSLSSASNDPSYRRYELAPTSLTAVAVPQSDERSEEESPPPPNDGRPADEVRTSETPGDIQETRSTEIVGASPSPPPAAAADARPSAAARWWKKATTKKSVDPDKVERFTSRCRLATLIVFLAAVAAAAIAIGVYIGTNS